jgi:hypothetical protein
MIFARLTGFAGLKDKGGDWFGVVKNARKGVVYGRD